MTDSKLRELERRWKETGSVEDEAAYLLERVRVGDLEQERLELAAYCGNQGARSALGKEAPQIPTGIEDRLWGLLRWGFPVFVRGLVGLVEADASGASKREPVRAAIAWCDCPCPEHAEAAGVAASRAVIARDLVGELVAGAAYSAGRTDRSLAAQSLRESMARRSIEQLITAIPELRVAWVVASAPMRRLAP